MTVNGTAKLDQLKALHDTLSNGGVGKNSVTRGH
jgi:hypothetical protein